MHVWPRCSPTNVFQSLERESSENNAQKPRIHEISKTTSTPTFACIWAKLRFKLHFVSWNKDKHSLKDRQINQTFLESKERNCCLFKGRKCNAKFVYFLGQCHFSSPKLPKSCMKNWQKELVIKFCVKSLIFDKTNSRNWLKKAEQNQVTTPEKSKVVFKNQSLRCQIFFSVHTFHSFVVTSSFLAVLFQPSYIQIWLSHWAMSRRQIAYVQQTSLCGVFKQTRRPRCGHPQYQTNTLTLKWTGQ